MSILLKPTRRKFLSALLTVAASLYVPLSLIPEMAKATSGLFIDGMDFGEIVGVSWSGVGPELSLHDIRGRNFMRTDLYDPGSIEIECRIDNVNSDLINLPRPSMAQPQSVTLNLPGSNYEFTGFVTGVRGSNDDDGKGWITKLDMQLTGVIYVTDAL